MENKKIVLIIEDSEDFVFLMKEYLRLAGIDAIAANNYREAMLIFNQQREDIQAIILDACLESHEIDTLPLLKKLIQAGFSGPIVAGSMHEKHNELLKAAGATHQALKHLAAQLTIKLLASNT